MIQKMPTDNNICKLCKDIAAAIPKMEQTIDKLQQKYDKAVSRPSASRKVSADELQAQLDEYTHYLQSLQIGYKAILGVAYGSEQTHEAYKPQMKEYVCATLYRRGIMKVEYEDIEPKNGKEYVRLHWTEKLE